MKKILTPKYIVAIFVALIIVFTNKAEASTGTVTTETLNLRSEASTSSSVIKLLNINEKVEIISEEGNWYKVEAGDKEGYVSKDYIKLDADNSTKQEMPTSTNTGVANTANTEKEDEKGLLYEVKVANSDMGKVIGKQGKVAKSIRTVMKSIAGKEHKKVSIEFLED